MTEKGRHLLCEQRRAEASSRGGAIEVSDEIARELVRLGYAEFVRETEPEN